MSDPRNSQVPGDATAASSGDVPGACAPAKAGPAAPAGAGTDADTAGPGPHAGSLAERDELVLEAPASAGWQLNRILRLLLPMLAAGGAPLWESLCESVLRAV